MKAITRDELKARLDRGESVVLLEALPEKYYRDGHLPQAQLFPHDQVRGAAPRSYADPALGEFTNPDSIIDVKLREHTFARELARNHERLLLFAHSDDYAALAVHSELLREIRLDIETSQSSQVEAFCDAVYAR